MYSDKIEANPSIMMGKPVIKGTRITVEIILRKLSQGIAVEEILNNYPQLSKEDIQAALECAAESICSEEIHLFS